MKRKTLILMLVMLMAFASMSCKKELQIEGLELEVNFSETPLSDNLIVDMLYKWKTKDDFIGMRYDYNVFVHFWHKKNMLFQDDHIPEVQTSEWRAGKEYAYSRQIYIPAFIDKNDPEFKGVETLKLSVGLYSPYDRTGKSQQKILDEKLKVSPPPPGTPEITYETGWYGLEVNPETYLKKWRWTAQEARCTIDNPHRDALLIIKGGINPNALENQKIMFRINDSVVDDFIPEETFFEKTYSIKKEMIGVEDKFELVISTDKTFVPAQITQDSEDDRELGVMISFIYFR
jgi:hypothetical protein